MAEAHPTNEHLAGYAVGTLSEGMSLLVATHLTYCPACRARVAQLECIGGAVLMDTPRERVSPPSVDAALARLDSLEDAAPLPADPGSPLPTPLRREFGARMDAIDWKFLLPGLHEAVLDGFEGEKVSLLRARPGVRILGHTHDGEEATLILQGEMDDEGTIYRRGDVALCDHTHDHRPRIVGEEPCICLIVVSGNLRFTGPVGRALNLFAR